MLSLFVVIIIVVIVIFAAAAAAAAFAAAVVVVVVGVVLPLLVGDHRLVGVREDHREQGELPEKHRQPSFFCF